jgi:hypothetical protein
MRPVCALISASPGQDMATRAAVVCVSLMAGIRYWADAPENGPEGIGFRIALTFLVPK